MLLRDRKNICFSRWIFSALIFTISSYCFASPYSKTVYVQIDYPEGGHHDGMMHSAYVFDENFEPLGNSSDTLTGRIPLPSTPVWYLGSKIDIVTRVQDANGGNIIDVVSDDPRFYEMNHHLTVAYRGSDRPVYDPCGNIRPLAAGSELTDIRLPSGYGFRMQGGELKPAAWHWANPYGLPKTDNVYIRFIILFDDNPDGYRDTHVTWISQKKCGANFAVPPGMSERIGPDYSAPTTMRVVAVIPHVHDHVIHSDFQKNGVTLHHFIPENTNIATAHDDMGDGGVPLHAHPDHLPGEGLTPWTPGIYGPVLLPGESLNSYAEFNNPHDVHIDNMNNLVTFWERLPQIVE